MGAPRLERLDKNIIINGWMDYWQRVVGGTTTINDAAGGNTYTADRYLCGRAGSTTKNFSILRSTDVPTIAQAGGKAAYSYQVNFLTAHTPAATDTCSVMQYRLEGYDYAKIHDKTVAIGFWIKLTSTATFPITNFPVALNGTTHSYVTHVTINANNTWQFVKFQVPMGIFGTQFTTSLAMRLTIGSASGSNFQTATLNSWVSGPDYFNSSASFNLFSVNTNVMRVTGVTLIEGTTDMLNEGSMIRAGANISEELALCQRYYEKSYDLENTPGTITSQGDFDMRITNSGTGQAVRVYFRYKVRKRIAGVSAICWSTISAGAPNKLDVANSTIAGTVSQLTSGEDSCSFEGVVSAAQMGNCHINAHYTAECEL